MHKGYGGYAYSVNGAERNRYRHWNRNQRESAGMKIKVDALCRACKHNCKGQWQTGDPDKVNAQCPYRAKMMAQE